MSRPALLKIEGLSVRFGGLRALDDVNIEISSDERIVGVIGANGAGKSTLFGAIVGQVRPSGGKIYLNDTDISSVPSNRRIQHGVARTHQIVRLFTGLTIRENLLVAASFSGRTRGDAHVSQILDSLELTRIQNLHPGVLPFALQKRVELARALAANPVLLMLDEVASGLNHSELQWLKKFLQHLPSLGVTIVVVEHILSFVMELCSRVIVLDEGRILATGTPTDIQNNPAVIRAYLKPTIVASSDN